MVRLDLHQVVKDKALHGGSKMMAMMACRHRLVLHRVVHLAAVNSRKRLASRIKSLKSSHANSVGVRILLSHQRVWMCIIGGTAPCWCNANSANRLSRYQPSE